MFKKQWICPHCTQTNDAKYSYCVNCGNVRENPNGHKPDGRDHHHNDGKKLQKESKGQ